MPSRRRQKGTDKCSYCDRDRTEDAVGSQELRWICCNVCEKWAHISCFEFNTSTVGSVNRELWTLIRDDPQIYDNWVFTCSKCDQEGTSIPKQLVDQGMVSHQQLVDMGVETTLFKVDTTAVAPQPATDTTTEPTPSTSRETSAAMVPPTSPTSHNPLSSDLQAMLKFMMEQQEKERKERQEERQEKERERLFKEAKEERECKAREEKEERECKAREEKEERECKAREEKEERERKAREEKEDKDRQERERVRKEERQDRLDKEERDRQERERREEKTDERFAQIVKGNNEQVQKMEEIRLQKEDEFRAEQMKMIERLEESRSENLMRPFGQPPTGESTRSAQSDRAKIGLKLPVLKIPTFNGDLLKWLEFWDMFTASVHENPDLSPVQKLSHLKAQLEGQARDSISQLAMTNDNYEVAVELLKKRYGNRRLIQEKLLGKLQSLSTSSMRLDDLRRTFHTVEQSLEQLKNLDDDFAQQSCDAKFFVNMIKQKFPPKIIVEIEEDQKDDWTLQDLMPKIEHHIIKFEREANLRTELYGHKATGCFPQLSQPSPKGNYSSGPTGNRSFLSSKPKGSAGTLMASGGTKQTRNGKNVGNFSQRQSTYLPLGTFSKNMNQNKDSKPNWKPMYPCVFCEQKGHFPDECDKYTTPETRKAQLYIAKRCFMCLRDDHIWKRCTNPWRFRPCRGCHQIGVHHYSLCKDWINQKAKRNQSHVNLTFQERQMGTFENSQPPVPAGNHMATGDMSHLAVLYKSVMQTTKLPVQDPASKRILHANVFMDSGSNICWMSKNFCQRLGLKERYKKTISVKTFGTLQEKVIGCFATGVDLFTMDNQNFPIEVTVIDNLASPLSKPALNAEDLKFLEANKHRYRLAPETTSQWKKEFPVDIIIGQDYYWHLINVGGKAIGLPSGLQLIPSKFGYLLGGGSLVSESSPSTHQSISHFVMSQPNEVFSTLTSKTEVKMDAEPALRLEDFWELERIGVLDSPVENDDDRALDGFNETIKFENGRYQSTWMWKSDEVDLPDNYGLALGRFKSLAKRFQDDPDLYKKYAAIIEEQLQKGIIEKVDGRTETGPRQHYLPHHPVVTPLKETTKVRIVYDASARVRKDANSLNDCLYRGPVILPDLCGLLMRFRTYPIAILADIEKAFLQIGLQTPDRDVTRFLWFRNPENPNFRHPEQDVQIYRFCRVAFGVICSPSILEATVKYHLNQVGTEIALNIADNIYVDNVLVGAQNSADALQIYSASKKIFSSASMNLREWTSNSVEFLEQIPESDRAKMNKPAIKVLGLLWNLKEDEIQIAGSDFDKLHSAASKREVLCALARIFDPLGFFTPITFHGKLFMEKLWSLNKSWDDLLPDELKQQWKEVADNLVEIGSVKLQRFLNISVYTNEFQLMVFCDASEKAYGTAVYLRHSSNNGFQTHLMFAKNRLAPKVKTKKEDGKLSSVPKLELLGVLIGVRAANFVQNHLKLEISQVTIWTDSECVLHWLKSKKPAKVFVENRLKEIRKSKNFSFRYVRSVENPADLITRGSKVADLKDNSLWWHGPDWLQLTCDQWPKANVPALTPELLEIVKSETKTDAQISFSSREGPAEKIGISAVIDENRFSKFGKLIGTTCYVLRFIRKKIYDRISEDKKPKLGFLKIVETTGELTVKERNLAENLWIYSSQKTYYSQIFCDIQQKKRNPMQMQLGLKIDSDGLLRCHGRLGLAELNYDAKYPVLIPCLGQFTTLLIQSIHKQLYHGGTSHTLAQLRTQFWIPKGRKIVGNVIRKCLICKRYQGGPYQLPSMPDLPKERVNQTRPFQYVGIDYLGPVYCKNGNEVSKAWICLFTCMAVRAVHLELVLSMDTKCFLDCFRRFVARYGKPDRVISDNAPTFKLADRTLDFIWSKVVTNPEALEYFSTQKIEWSFITELAPWQGGFYERLVGLVKKCLRKALGKKFYDWAGLQTILEEIRAVINSRPLTFVYNELNEGQVVRPSDFMGLPNIQNGPPPVNSDQKDPEYIPGDVSSAQKLGILWREQQNRVDQFWELWRDDYLLSLRERFQTEHRGPRIGTAGSPTPGEIVLVYTDKQPRGSWPLAKVVELKQGSDGAVRSVKLRFADGNELNRAVNFLYPLEIPCSQNMKIPEKNLVPIDNSNGQDKIQDVQSGNRPSRKAADRARERIREQLQNGDMEFVQIATLLTQLNLSSPSRITPSQTV